MRFQRSRSHVLEIIVFFLLALFELISLFAINSSVYSLLIHYSALIVILGFGLDILLFVVVGLNRYYVSFLFIILLYLFNFGQIILLGLANNYVFYHYNYLAGLNSQIVKSSIIACFIYIKAFELGILVESRKGLSTSHISGPKLNLQTNELNVMRLRYVSAIVLFLFLPIDLYKNFSLLTKAFSGGYAATFATETGTGSGVIDALANFPLSALCLLIFAERSNPKKAGMILGVAISFKILFMFYGERGHQLIGIFLLLYVYMRYVRPANSISPAKIALYSIGFLFLISLVSEIREFGILYFIENIGDVFVSVSSRNILLETIEVLGETFINTYFVIEQISMNNMVFQYGQTFLKSLASFLPNINNIFTSINNEAILSKVLAQIYGHHLGGSIIAELYYNFGLYGSLVAFFLGRLLMKAERTMNNLDDSSGYRIAFIIPFFYCMLWLVRDSFANTTRIILWQYILFIILIGFVNDILGLNAKGSKYYAC